MKTMHNSAWRLCVAPMIDVTDRHCRYFHRLLAPRARLYTEMITTGALLYGNAGRHLDFDPAEHPLALQLGGSEPQALAHAAALGQKWGYDEINLNCGCPSERVQRGAFGACLMAEPDLVADCIKAMQDAVTIPVTVKHRLGLDNDEDYGFVRDFVGALHRTGCRTFIVHARNAVLKGLSPKDNREIPPLRYDAVRRLKNDFPDCSIVLNGGLTGVADCADVLAGSDGVMLGRAAWHTPGVLGDISQHLWPHDAVLSECKIIERMSRYGRAQIALGVPLRFVVKPMLGMFNGREGARLWRRTLSDAALLAHNDTGLIMRAWEQFVAAADTATAT